MKACFLFFLIVFFSFNSLKAQVLTDFDTDSLAGWRSEGDGQYLLEEDMGNPGACMRINDDATGDLNIAIAPVQFLGNWSAASQSDSIMTDVYISQLSGSIIPNPWVFRISGPGGSASTLISTPTVAEWLHISIPMDSTAWTISSGNWSALLEYVNHMEGRAEFISGDEFIRLDNIGITFTPVTIEIVPLVISDFEKGQYEGWTFESSGGTSIPASGGNPGRYIRINDGDGLTHALAPPKFLGDWSLLENQAAVMFDLQISGFSGPFIISEYLIKISGPGGEATVTMDSSIIKSFNQWYTHSILVSEENWNLISGEWDALLSDIRELRMIVEYINGSETVWLDNFRITDDPPVAGFTADPLYIFQGEEVQFMDQSLNAPISWEWDFGDGGSSLEQMPIHTYSEPGFYDVSLKGSNQFGSDTLLQESFIEVAGITDSILFEDDFEDSDIHPAWRLTNGTWQENNGTLAQTSNHYEPGNILGGCYAVVGSPLWKNYRMLVDFRSTDNDKIGAVFNYQDEDNFYLFTWQLEATHRAIKRVINGEWTNISVDTVEYVQNQWYQLDIRTEEGRIDLFIDSSLVYSLMDTTYQTGKAGLYCYGNQSSFWDNFKIVNLDYQPTAISYSRENIVNTFTLEQNYPNPFNPSTTISFTLPEKQQVVLEVFNTIGQRIEILYNRELPTGSHDYNFNAASLPSGIYYYRLTTGGYQQIKKMILLK